MLSVWVFPRKRGVDPGLGLKLLQSAAKLAQVPPAVANEIAWAHIQLGDFDAAITSASHAITLKPDSYEGSVAMAIGMRAGVYEAEKRVANAQYESAVEMIEAAANLADSPERDAGRRTSGPSGAVDRLERAFASEDG